MLSFLFWNLQKKSLQDLAAKLALEHNVGVLLLAECCDKIDVLSSLRRLSNPDWQCANEIFDRVMVFYRPSYVKVRARGDDRGGRIGFFHLDSASRGRILMVAVHLRSLEYANPEELTVSLPRIADAIEYHENEKNHRLSTAFVVGDFNVDPYDAGMRTVDGLNASMTRRGTGLASRTVEGMSRQRFYNPMWGFFGDRTVGPAGSFYYGSAPSEPWHIFDQLLLRSGLADALDEVLILDRVGEESLVSDSGIPNTSRGSDHLPLFFRLSV